MAKLTALGAYIFAGGFTLGVREHFRVLGHLEQWPFGCETSRVNLGIPVYEETGQWDEALDLLLGPPRGRARMRATPLDLLYANPPCAPWSAAGMRTDRPDWRTDPRVECWRNTLQVYEKTLPKVLCVESVRPLYQKGRDLLASVAAQGRSHGYQPIVLLENAFDYGVPQDRKRMMMILTRFAWQPLPALGPVPPTVGEVLKAVKRLKIKGGVARDLPPSIKRVLPALTPGIDGRRAHQRLFPKAQKDHRGKIAGRPGFLTRRLASDKIAPVMMGGCHWVHPTEDRFVSVPENAALCGFPPDYRFINGGGDHGNWQGGAIGAAYPQMGKGVMPPVGAGVAKMAALTIKRGKPVDRKLPALEITIHHDTVEVKEIDL